MNPDGTLEALVFYPLSIDYFGAGDAPWPKHPLGYFDAPHTSKKDSLVEEDEEDIKKYSKFMETRGASHLYSTNNNEQLRPLCRIVLESQKYGTVFDLTRGSPLSSCQEEASGSRRCLGWQLTWVKPSNYLQDQEPTYSDEASTRHANLVDGCSQLEFL
eukprot:gnl/Spiro4/28322_TR14010_c0_g1_i1.p1 gnl/Spiro4/28322_TR14010_c0_g1~~gnl/Spiro4/28322_TR14010_c0_g1_i1.p1  ORF type:complete len:159 (-),score=16.76 gnl/Spiro4/28322_TR14010_c0_g1_i1:23-499(-)